MLHAISQHIRHMGPVGFFLFAFTCVVAVTLLIYIRLPGAVGLPAPASEVKVVPALGIEGYTGTLEFCKDSTVTVKELMIPDTKAFQLTRTKDGRSESIGIALDPNNDVTYATYSADGLTPLPAQVTDAAKKCLQDRVK